MNIAMLIGVMIAIVIGVTFASGIVDTVANTTAQGGNPLSPAMQTMLDILPVIYVTVIILGAVAWIGGSATGRRTARGLFESIRLHGVFGGFRNSPFLREYFSRRVLEISGAELMQKIGVEAVLIDRLFDNSVTDVEPIDMQERDNWWVDTNYDWYIVEKHPKFEMYKMVGLHKRQRGLNCVYVLGKDSHTETPYMLRCPPEYLKQPIMECVRWNMNIDEAFDLKEV